MTNLIVNSEMSICSVLIPVRVGAPIPVSTWASWPSQGSGVGKFVAPGFDGSRLQPGKLFFVEGARQPHISILGLPVSMSGSKRITCPFAGNFSGVQVGDWCRISAAENGTPLVDYHITATDGSTYIETFGGTGGSILPNTPASIDVQFYAGAKDVHQTVNGQKATCDPFFEAMHSYSLQSVGAEPGAVYGTLSGWYSDALSGAPGTLWEVTPGDNGYGSTDASDGCMKSATLRWWQTYKIGWAGEQVVRDGSLYGCKLKKGISGIERLWWSLCQRAPANRSKADEAMLSQLKGKTFTFGMEFIATSANKVRPYFWDGSTYTYGPFYTPGAFDWQEVTFTVPTTATAAQSGLEIDGAVGDEHYATQPMCDKRPSLGRGSYEAWHGTLPLTMHQHPVRYVSSPALPPTQRIRLAQETNGQLRSVKAVYLDLEGRCTRQTPVSNPESNSMFLMDGPETFSPGVVLLSYKAAGDSAEPPLHMAQSYQPVGLVAAGPSGFLADQLFLQCNSPGWHDMTIDIIAVEV